MDSPLNIRKILKIGGAVVFVIVLILLTIRYFNTGGIIVTSKTPHNAISLFSADERSDPEAEPITGHNKLSKSVPSGMYLLTVSANSNQTNQLVEVHGRKTSSYRINLASAVSVEPVTTVNAQDIYATSDQLIFFDKGTGNLAKIDAETGLTKAYTVKPLRNVKWASNGQGIGQGVDGKLYKINGASIELLDVPFTYNRYLPVDYSVSSNNQLYISSGPKVYLGSLDGPFKEIYKSSMSSPKLVAGPDKLAINKPGREGGSGMIANIISSSGEELSGSIDYQAQTWSPNGRFLATTANQGGSIYDTTTKKSTLLPAQSVAGGFVWQGNGTLIYASEGSLWSYNTYSKQAKLMANMPLDEPINEVTIDQDGSYVYLTTLGTSGKTTIRRVGLKSQPVPPVVYDLQVILPDEVGVCSLSYINFPAPTVFVTSTPRQATAERCLIAAKSYLRSYKIDPASIQLVSKVIDESN